jgi:hypothetical protein
MRLPRVKRETIEGIVGEICSKNETFGVEEFRSNLEKDNEDLADGVYGLIEILAEYMCGGDEIRLEESCAIAKLSCNLLYKSMEKQIEINEMSYE